MSFFFDPRVVRDLEVHAVARVPDHVLPDDRPVRRVEQNAVPAGLGVQFPLSEDLVLLDRDAVRPRHPHAVVRVLDPVVPDGDAVGPLDDQDARAVRVVRRRGVSDREPLHDGARRRDSHDRPFSAAVDHGPRPGRRAGRLSRSGPSPDTSLAGPRSRRPAAPASGLRRSTQRPSRRRASRRRPASERTG